MIRILALLLSVASASAVTFSIPSNRVAADYYRAAIDAGFTVEVSRAGAYLVASNVMHYPGPVAPDADYSSNPTNSSDWWTAYTASQPFECVAGVAVPDVDHPGLMYRIVVSDGSVVASSSNHIKRVQEIRDIRRDVREVRTNTIVLIDDSTNRISQSSTIIGDVSGIAVTPSSTTAQVRSAVVDLKDATTELAVHTREMDRAIRDTQRELRALAAALGQYMQPTNQPGQ